MKIIGITGNSGTGKSEFSKILAQKMDAKLIDADKIAKQSAMPGKKYYSDLVECLGEEILTKEKLINRKKMAEIVYHDEKRRKLINELTTKHIVEKIRKEVKENKDKNVVMDVPLLFENELDKICHVTISMIADERVKIQRVCKRDKITEEVANNRIFIQKKDEYYIEKSNYVLTNNHMNLEKEAEELIIFCEKDLFNREIVVIKDEDIKYLQIKKLLKYENLIHCFTLKPSDFGDNQNYEEKKEDIKNEYKKISKSLKVNGENIIRPYQTHTDNVEKVINEKGIYHKNFQNVDALITKQKDRVLSLTFADCTPIYIFDKEENVIALVHSGWTGTTKKIIKKAIQKMKNEYNSKPENLICAIGPTIRKCHFEVEEEVKNIFYHTFRYMKNIDKIIEKGTKVGKYYIDTVEINKNMMKEEGVLVENIVDCGICSLCNNEFIHSYRKEGKQAGRNTAIMCLK